MESTIIQSDPEVFGGTPVFRGTRVPIQALFDCLEGSTVEEFLKGYPHITREMVNEVLTHLASPENVKVKQSGRSERIAGSLEKYRGRGDGVWQEDAQTYINGLRDDDRF